MPLGAPSDEPSHIGYARLVADHAALPSGGVREKQQPPLYYLLAAGLLRLGASPQVVRGLSVVLGAATLAAVMATARVLRPDERWTAVGAGALVALLPGFVAVSAAVSDDSLAWLAGAVLVLLTCMVALREPPDRALTFCAACAIGLALLSKESDWPPALVLAAVLVWRWRGRLTPSGLLAAAACPSVIAGWWFVRNLVTFHRPTPPLAPITSARQHLRSVAQLRGFASEFVHSLFGPEAANGGPLPRSSAALALIAVVSTALGVLMVAAVLRTVRSWARLPRAVRACVLALTAECALVAAAWLANSVVLDLQPQARYLLVAVAAPAVAVAAEAGSAGRRRPRVTAAGVAVVAALLLALGADAVRVALHAGA